MTNARPVSKAHSLLPEALLASWALSAIFSKNLPSDHLPGPVFQTPARFLTQSHQSSHISVALCDRLIPAQASGADSSRIKTRRGLWEGHCTEDDARTQSQNLNLDRAAHLFGHTAGGCLHRHCLGLVPGSNSERPLGSRHLLVTQQAVTRPSLPRAHGTPWEGQATVGSLPSPTT